MQKTDQAVETLQALPRRLDGRMWNIKASHGATQAFTRVCRRAGIEKLRGEKLRVGTKQLAAMYQ